MVIKIYIGKDGKLNWKGSKLYNGQNINFTENEWVSLAHNQCYFKALEIKSIKKSKKGGGKDAS